MIKRFVKTALLTTPVIIVFMLCMAAAPPLSAEIYQYRDASGVLHFTDNLLDVPQAQRNSVNTAPEISSPAPEPRLDEPAAEEPQKPDQRRREYRQLLEEQETLDRLFLDLEAQKIALNEQRKKITTQKQLQAYRQEVDAYNRQVLAFTERRESFAQKSREFNRKNTAPSP